MKKAKIMLVAITVFAVIGGALAFNVKSSNRFYSKVGANCDSEIFTTLTTATQPGDVTFATSLSESPVSGDCPIITVKETQ